LGSQGRPPAYAAWQTTDAFTPSVMGVNASQLRIGPRARRRRPAKIIVPDTIEELERTEMEQPAQG